MHGLPKERRVDAEKTMTRLADVSTIVICGSAATQEETHARETGVKSVIKTEAPHANGVTARPPEQSRIQEKEEIHQII